MTDPLIEEYRKLHYLIHGPRPLEVASVSVTVGKLPGEHATAVTFPLSAASLPGDAVLRAVRDSLSRRYEAVIGTLADMGVVLPDVHNG